jgi:hypothetical protein
MKLARVAHQRLFRKRVFQVLTVMALVVVLPSAWAADDAVKQIAPRTELYQIQTLTLSDRQFLKGDSTEGKAVTIAGQLRLAQGNGRLPVVVLQHASSATTRASMSGRETLMNLAYRHSHSTGSPPAALSI